MKSTKNWMKEFWRDDRGQSTTEYILILSVVVMVALKFKKQFEGTMKEAVNTLDGKIKAGLQDDG